MPSSPEAAGQKAPGTGDEHQRSDDTDQPAQPDKPGEVNNACACSIREEQCDAGTEPGATATASAALGL